MPGLSVKLLNLIKTKKNNQEDRQTNDNEKLNFDILETNDLCVF